MNICWIFVFNRYHRSEIHQILKKEWLFLQGLYHHLQYIDYFELAPSITLIRQCNSLFSFYTMAFKIPTNFKDKTIYSLQEKLCMPLIYAFICQLLHYDWAWRNVTCQLKRWEGGRMIFSKAEMCIGVKLLLNAFSPEENLLCWSNQLFDRWTNSAFQAQAAGPLVRTPTKNFMPHVLQKKSGYMVIIV